MAKAILAVVAVAALAVQLAAAAVDHPVGGDGAWDASGTSYNAWSTKQKFVQGDTVSFKYAPSHDVTEVTKAGYDACSGSNAVVKSYTGGATTVKLATPGKRYFICSVPGHCAAGMKLELTVAAAAAPAPAAAPKSQPPRRQRSIAPTPAPTAAPEAPAAPSPSTDVSGLPTVTSPAAAPAPKSSDATSVGVQGAKAGVALAVGMVLALAI
ncbi:hypothetical protein EJB05_13654, partial [Eragrostis curvula]